MSWLADALNDRLQQLPPAQRYLIAFSGGADSTALLQGLLELRGQLSPSLMVVHVDHGLQLHSGQWAQRCAEYCARTGLEFIGTKLNLLPQQGESPEAAARHARYAALADQMLPGDILLTAHHQDDQAETLLLHLLRGSGLPGLSAMPFSRLFGPGLLARPLLDFSRRQLQQYLEQCGLDWIDDPSNQCLDFDRNFLRHQIMPLLRQRWPSAVASLSRSAGHCAEARDLLFDQADTQLERLCPAPEQLQLDVFAAAGLGQRHWLMRAWLRRLRAPVPNAAVLERLCVELVQAAPDRNPLVCWGGVAVRRYRGRLYFQHSSQQDHAASPLDWPEPVDLDLPGNGRLCLRPATAGLDSKLWQQHRLQVRYRKGGERCPSRHKPLKRLLQEAAIPPWQRDRVPLLYAGERLIAIANLGVCDAQARSQGPGLELHWIPSI